MNNPVLLELFRKSFTNDKDEEIEFYEIHLSDRLEQEVFRMKPADTKKFDSVYKKSRDFLGKEVKLKITHKKNKAGERVAHVEDIELAK